MFPLPHGSTVFISFVDENGVSGRVSEDLTVEYDGDWLEEIEDFLGELEAEFSIEEDREAGSDPDLVHEVLIELPEQVPIVEVERHDE